MVIFHSYVKLPEGTPFIQGKEIPVFHPHGHLFLSPTGPGGDGEARYEKSGVCGAQRVGGF